VLFQLEQLNYQQHILIILLNLIALIAYNRHARIIFKNNKNLHIIDPWKQTASRTKNNTEFNFY